MADDVQYGLGALPSPPDDRDWPISLLYAATATEPVAAVPDAYLAPAPFPPIYDQGSTPQCVAYSNGASKSWQDLRDTGLFAPDQALFFSQIGGTANGAVPRVALQQMLDHGYPPKAAAAQAGSHRIAAYYAVPLTQADIQQAILAFGPVLLSTEWFNSWFHPNANGVLPGPDTVVGGHEILAVGWDSRGLRLRNSWGVNWGQQGDAYLPWAYLSHAREVWKSVDVIETPPKPVVYTLHVAAGAHVTSYKLSSTGCLTDQQLKVWGRRSSSAGCRAPVVKRGCSRGTATVVYVPNGAFAARWVKLGPGVTVTHT